MWTRKVSFIASFRCCRNEIPEGAGGGKEWYVRIPIEEDTDYHPIGTLFNWAKTAIDENFDRIKLFLDQECEHLFGGTSHLELCEGSVVLSDIVIEQFVGGRRTVKDTLPKVGKRGYELRGSQ